MGIVDEAFVILKSVCGQNVVESSGLPVWKDALSHLQLHLYFINVRLYRDMIVAWRFLRKTL